MCTGENAFMFGAMQLVVVAVLCIFTIVISVFVDEGINQVNTCLEPYVSNLTAALALGGYTASAPTTAASTCSVGNNDCTFSNDGSCDDGGPGAEWAMCASGTDCDDCDPPLLYIPPPSPPPVRRRLQSDVNVGDGSVNVNGGDGSSVNVDGSSVNVNGGDGSSVQVDSNCVRVTGSDGSEVVVGIGCGGNGLLDGMMGDDGHVAAVVHTVVITWRNNLYVFPLTFLILSNLVAALCALLATRSPSAPTPGGGLVAASTICNGILSVAHCCSCCAYCIFGMLMAIGGAAMAGSISAWVQSNPDMNEYGASIALCFKPIGHTVATVGAVTLFLALADIFFVLVALGSLDSLNKWQAKNRRRLLETQPGADGQPGAGMAVTVPMGRPVGSPSGLPVATPFASTPGYTVQPVATPIVHTGHVVVMPGGTELAKQV